MKDLNITLIQTDIIWENIDANLKQYETKYLSKIKPNQTDLILFPELFSTGFSMQTKQLAETMNGKTIKWMQQWADKLNCQIGGSLIIEENNQYFNRFLIVSKNGIETHYDKRHLFRMGEENEHFTAGNNRIIYDLNGWKILLQVCYDLRFPVYARNQTINTEKEYDALIYVANWPEVRSKIWSTLLKARAIENQAYCIGLNRVGVDGNDINHSGNSAIINPWGETVKNLTPNTQFVENIPLQSSVFEDIKTKFPAYLDADQFHLTDK